MHTNHHHNEGPQVKYVTLRDLAQFENDSRRILQHYQAYVPNGDLQVIDLRNGSRVIKQRFVQQSRRLSWDAIDSIIEELMAKVSQNLI
jgi:hypothetical protein